MLFVIKKLLLFSAAPLLLSRYKVTLRFHHNRYIECIGIIYSLKYWAKNESVIDDPRSMQTSFFSSPSFRSSFPHTLVPICIPFFFKFTYFHSFIYYNSFRIRFRIKDKRKKVRSSMTKFHDSIFHSSKWYVTISINTLISSNLSE